VSVRVVHAAIAEAMIDVTRLSPTLSHVKDAALWCFSRPTDDERGETMVPRLTGARIQRE
jgi:hypothetical protein